MRSSLYKLWQTVSWRIVGRYGDINEEPELAYLFECTPWKDFLSLPVIDIGSHFGEFALRFLKSGFCVESFEPCPENVMTQKRRLRRFIAKNQIRIHPVAASSETGYAMLKMSSADTLHSLCSEWSEVFPEYFHGSKSIPVRTVALAPYLANLGYQDVFLAKIDVEGHEYEVINGLECGGVSMWPFMVMFEICEPLIHRSTSILQVLETKGYHTFAWWIKRGTGEILYHDIYKDAHKTPPLMKLQRYYGNIVASRLPCHG